MNRSERAGFSLIELLIVIAMIGILVGLAIPQYKHAIMKSREVVLKENLFQIRKIINQYYTDKMKYPDSMQALVDEEYFHALPLDPITGSAETWVEIWDTLTADDIYAGISPGIRDVTSGSNEKSLDGTAYNTW
jgi:general secretion pathway protein G